ncbi:recombinase family protein [Arthrobacter sp. TMS1-12-1]
MERAEQLNGVEEPRLVPVGVSLGYARVSTKDQNVEAQRRLLVDVGCYDVYTDIGKSGATMSRPQLDQCLRALQPGNTLVVTKLDRLGRTVRGLVELLDSLNERGVLFRSLGEGIDTTTPTGQVMLNTIASVAEMERELIRERTKVGLAVAAGKGGRPLKLKPHDVAEARRLREEGRSLVWIAERLGVGKSTITRALRSDGLGGAGYGGMSISTGSRGTSDGAIAQAQPN